MKALSFSFLFTVLCVFFAFCVFSTLSAAAEVNVDFTQESGTIKPLHGINNSPVTYGEKLPELERAGIPFCRLHDTAGAFGGTYFVDIPNLFPNFDADPEDPASYEFTFTDAYLKGLTKSGVKIFYRLGVTIENHHALKAFRVHPPKDYEKFAKICEMIVRHYNEGWADGMHLGIEYWEIWNEPENPAMWTGTRQQYYDLYRVTANHLKKTFPSLKVGGFASCGFYALGDEKASEFHKSFITWFEDFLKYVQAPETRAPLDFFSWHLYTDDPKQIAAHAAYVDEKLREAGLENTESIFDEWNRLKDWSAGKTYDDMKDAPGASFCAAAFCVMQAGSIDKAMYYDAYPARRFGGLYYYPSLRVTKTYYSFLAFNTLYQLETSVPITVAGNENLYAVAAKKAGKGAVLLANYSSEEISAGLHVQGLTVSAEEDAVKVTLTDAQHTFEETPEILQDGKISLPPESVILLQYGF